MNLNRIFRLQGLDTVGFPSQILCCFMVLFTSKLRLGHLHNVFCFVFDWCILMNIYCIKGKFYAKKWKKKVSIVFWRIFLYKCLSFVGIVNDVGKLWISTYLIFIYKSLIYFISRMFGPFLTKPGHPNHDGMQNLIHSAISCII